MALSEPAPAPLSAPLATTHRVISYTYPSTVPSLRSGLRLRTGDSLYRLITATYSSGEYYRYTYDRVGNRLSLMTSNGSTTYEYDAANRLVLSSYCAESKGEIEVLTIENS